MLTIYKTLFDYNTWANGNIIETVSRLRREDFTKEFRSTFRSIQSTLVHIISAEWAWLSRWNVYSPFSPLNPEDFPTIQDLRSRWEDVVNSQNKFLGKLTERKLSEHIIVKNFKGVWCSYPLWQMIMHVICHSNYHRGEINMMLHNFNGEPVSTDLLAYVIWKDSDTESTVRSVAHAQ